MLTSEASADGAPDLCSSNILDNIGCIEVLILRCAGPRNAKTVSAMALDGASDMPFQSLGLDGQPLTPESRSVYDDRLPFFSGRSSNHGPPPPMPYRSPYAETVYSHDTTNHLHHNSHAGVEPPPFAYARNPRPQSKYSAPISPSTRRPPPSIPSEAFQYGSGPIPPGPMMGSERSFYHTRPASVIVTNAPGVDPAWLDEMLTKAAKRGAEEARRIEPEQEPHRQHNANVENMGQPPGAWPQSPFEPMLHPVQSSQAAPQYDIGEKSGATWGSPDRAWSGEQLRSKSKSVNWDTEPTRDGRGGWTGPDETGSETWDTDETWGTKRPNTRRENQWNTEATTVRGKSEERARSPATTRTRQSRHSDGHRSRKSRSKSRPRSSKWDERRSYSSDNREDWVHVDARSDPISSSASTDDTEQQLRSRSHGRSSKERSQPKRQSYQAKSAHSGDRKSSRHIRGGDGSEATPTIKNESTHANEPVYATQIPQSRDGYAKPNSNHAPPQLSWVPPPPESVRKQSFGAPHIAPAPFSTHGGDFINSGSSMSWDTKKKDKKHQKEKSSWPTASHAKNQDAQNLWNSKDKRSDWKASTGAGWYDIVSDLAGKDDWAIPSSGNHMKDNWNTRKGEANSWTNNAGGWEARDDTKKQDIEAKGPVGWGPEFNNGNTPQNIAPPPWELQDQAWHTTTKSKEVQWPSNAPRGNNTPSTQPQTHWDTNPWQNVPPPPPPIHPNPSSPPNRHTTKSLSKYRHSSNTPKPHWHFPPPTNIPSITSPLPPEPALKITPEQACQTGLSHQTRLGAGTVYGHAISRPSYLDTLEKPYAVFRFKYRSWKVLGGMFGDAASPSLPSKRKEKVGKMGGGEEEIGGIVGLNGGKGRKDGTGKAKTVVSRDTESVARDWTESWVREHSREVSEEGWDDGGGWGDADRWT
jgi:hypothetical protein